jgi:hypothetical protein
MDVLDYMQQLGRQAREASRATARASTAAKDKALLAMAAAIRAGSAGLLAANAADVAEARANGLDAAMIDRLTLTAKGVETMALGVEQVATLPDPIGEITDLKRRPSGIQVGRMRVPLGVVGIIYEARPNVTADAAALCLKSGNAAILRGGKEALRSQPGDRRLRARGPRAAGLPETAVQVVDTTDREAVSHLVAMPRVRRCHRAARRQGPDRARLARREGAGDQAPRRQLPRVCRRVRRSGEGAAHPGEFQDPAPGYLQHDAESLLIARTVAVSLAPTALRHAQRKGRGNPRLRRNPQAGAAGARRDGRGLLHRVPGGDHFGQGRR